MKPIIVFFVMLLCGCNSINKAEKLMMGDWATCTKEGIYIEMNVTDSLFKFFSLINGMPVDIRYHYWINKDTLVYSPETDTQKKIASIHKVALTFENEEKMRWVYLTSNEVWVFDKITPRTSTPATREGNLNPDGTKKELSDFLERVARRNCPDK